MDVKPNFAVLHTHDASCIVGFEQDCFRAWTFEILDLVNDVPGRLSI